MIRHWENREFLKGGIARGGMYGHVLWFLGMLFAVLGIIADAGSGSLGLSATSWFLLAIVVMLGSVTFFIGLVISWLLVVADSKK